MVAAQLEVPIVLVQTARTLPSDDTGWTTQGYLRAVGGSEGSNQALGEQTLVQDFGVIKAQTARVFASIGLAPDIGRSFVVDDLVGLVVRLLKSDAAGTITINGATFSAYWHGVIQHQTIEPDLADNGNAGGRATWLAVGLACVLDGIQLTRGWVKSGSLIVDPGYLPPFNRQAGGDRSTATTTLNGAAVYLHVIGDTATSQSWTAAQILRLLIAGAGTPVLSGGTAAYGFAWSLSVANACLDYVPDEIDLGGLSLLQAVNLLASSRRAITWSVSVSGASAIITVRSAASEAIVVGGFTLAASTQTASLVAAGDPQIAGLVIDQDESTTFDVIEARGAHPWTGLTLSYPDEIGKGWNAGSETDWNNYPELPLYESIWRRFLVSSTWNETAQGGGAGLANTVATATSAAQGTGGLTGVRSQTAAADQVPGYHHVAERMLPCAEQFVATAIGARQAPVIVVFNGTTYEDMSLKWRVEVQSEPLGFVIDDGQHGSELRDRMALPGAKFFVSFGLREHRPLAVSWQRSPADFPRATPRVKLIQASGCELWQVRAGMVTGVAGDVVRGAIGASLATTAALAVRDDTARLDAVLALARAWFGVPTYKVRWTSRGELDTSSAFAPGTLLTSVQLGDRTLGTYALITRRTWQLVVRDDVEMWDTVYETQRVLPDLDVVL